MNTKTLKLQQKRQTALDRAKQMYGLRMKRYKYKEIAGMFNITTSRAEQIVKWYIKTAGK